MLGIKPIKKIKVLFIISTTPIYIKTKTAEKTPIKTQVFLISLSIFAVISVDSIPLKPPTAPKYQKAKPL